MTNLSARNSRREVFKRIKSGVVAIAIGAPDQRENIGVTSVPPKGLYDIVGTGFLVDRSGSIATAAHVVNQIQAVRENCKRRGVPDPDVLVSITHRGFLDEMDGLWTVRHHTRYVLESATYGASDIGFLNIGAVAEDHPLQPLVFADDYAEEGDEVALCGFPHGVRLHDTSAISASFASGIVSAVHPFRDSPPHERRKLQLDAQVLGGTSGGPVFDLITGEVTGLVIQNYAEVKRIPVGSSDMTVTVPFTISFAEDVFALKRCHAHAKEAWTRGSESIGETWSTLVNALVVDRAARAAGERITRI